jgi:hypothetical protein
VGPWSFVWVSPFLLSTLLAIPCRLSRVHYRGLKQNAVGGVLPNAPSTLCGFPTVTQGSAGLPVSLRACRTCTCSQSYFQSCPAWFQLSWLTYQARYVRVQVPVGRIRARCLSVRLPNPPVRTVLAAFIAHGSREKDVYRKCPFRQLHRVHRGQLARSLTTFVPFSLPSPSGPSPCM